jgi:putative tryptophan/tyrosine transport system substrate-binding protein
MVKRREIIGLFLGGAVVAWPFVALAQQPAMPVIGVLGSVSPGPYAPFIADFKAGLREAGYIEGKNVAIEYRWAEGDYDRLPSLAMELVNRRVNVIVLFGGGPAIAAAKAATTTIPIVATMGDDPVRLGIVAALNRPGGNITGVSLLTTSMEGKRLQLLHEMVAPTAMIAVILNPNNPQADDQLSDLKTAARSLGHQVEALKASSTDEINSAFATLAQMQAGGLVVAADAFFNTRAEQFVALSAGNRIPTIYSYRLFATAGGLMSYGSSIADGYHKSGVYAGRILKGDHPAELPIIQSERVELIINLKTAKTLGIKVPLPLTGRADELIE